MKHAITVVLQHFGVRVKAGVSKFGNFLRKQLYTVCGVAENDGLVDLEFGEEGIEAMDFLFLVYKAIVLRYTSEGELVHQIDFVGIIHVFVLENVSIWCRY